MCGVHQQCVFTVEAGTYDLGSQELGGSIATEFKYLKLESHPHYNLSSSSCDNRGENKSSQQGCAK